MKVIVAALAAALLLPSFSFAGHKSAVGSIVIDSGDSGIYGEHGENCAVRHYHGELNGVADPAPNGCGHGEVVSIAHGEGNGESLPPLAEKSTWDQFWGWVGSWFTKENAKNVVDVAAEANGLPPPNQVGELVDITKEMTPQIMEKAEGIKEYRESVEKEDDTLGIYNNLDNVPENPTISQRFFRWFNHLLESPYPQQRVEIRGGILGE